MKVKTFPKNKIIIFLLIFLTFCCNSEENPAIDEVDFIDIYANLLIINELKADISVKDSLVINILSDKNTTLEDFNITLEYYKQNSEDWVSVVQKTRDRIRELKNLQPGDSDPVE